VDPQDLLATALRATLLYVIILFVVRLLGKREVGPIGAFDLIVAFMLGEVVDEVIFGDVTLAKGFVAIAVVAAWHFANSWAGYRSALVERLTEGQATVLVENGVVKPEALASERMSEEELWSLLRSRGIGREEIEQVKYAVLEPSGALSVIKQEWAKPLEKGDLQRLTRGS